MRVEEVEGAEEEGETESLVDSGLSAEPDMELDPLTPRSLPELKPRVGPLTY